MPSFPLVGTDEPPLFELKDVVVAIEEARPLNGISLTIAGVGVTVILGASGSGKSTMLRLFNRLEVPTSGSVWFAGTDIAQLDPLRLRRQVGMVFQRPTLFPGTVRDNLRVAAPDADDDQLAAVLDRVGLTPEFLDRIGDDLSGGEAQRACLARTLVAGPEVVLMDEVTSSLDPHGARLLEETTLALAEQGVPVLWVTHDLDQGRRLDADPIVLHQGRLATPAERAKFFASTGNQP